MSAPIGCPRIKSFDLRFAKEFTFNNDVRMSVDLDWFNILNVGTVLGRQYDVGIPDSPTGPGQTLEIMNPSLLRLGVRFGF